MNAARQLYLETYGLIDTINFLVKKCHLFCISWKYWHAAKLHVDALALVIMYDKYKECDTESLVLQAFGIRQKDNIKVLDLHEFRGNCSKSGMEYNSAQQKYPGDEYM